MREEGGRTRAWGRGTHRLRCEESGGALWSIRDSSVLKVCVKVTNRVFFLCSFSRGENKPSSVVIKPQGWGRPGMD